ncbi:hypothetical protein SERLA73DRAFT_190981 [Serpula lacrymans var. lacrymans S7.3]|uniref:Phospholipase C/P1 nuclease n=2 Tax=Serpula lacrymans var. lacrymans TaxID=341189 RepID=F8QGR6_SERL3|nr:uncharacterized protein SERLADRAFT_457229 [Serpula lacrymans var. lacrymans S7.9]EGN92499.1 hypothetical protein SERLA73DRAFT_190981 [Serpula lacrymans var. lacrymans S7.3]EGO29454.1 hypothetical protein SERLADRAFT_457229 [Serpula lacrymans var. lacrymans S7.9]
MRVSFSSILTLALGSTVVPQVLAWGAAGHEIVATIAQIHLHPSVLPTLCYILNYNGTCHLAPVAAWADKIRYLPQFRWTAPLHYIGAVDDYPSETCAFPGERGWEGKNDINVLNGIRNVTGVLEDWVDLRRAGVTTASDNAGAQEALKFLIHFLGDMHMPLHLTGRDRGGNGDKVTFDGRVTNLHSVWDGLLIAQRLRTIPSNYTRPLPLNNVERHLRGTIYDPYVRRLIWEGVLGKYHDELQSWLTCPSTDAATPVTQSMWQQVVSLFIGQQSKDGGLGTDDEVLCPYYWAKPIHALNCEIAFPKELDEPPYSHALSIDDTNQFDESASWRKKIQYLELDTPKYAGVIREEWIVEKLLIQGGIRLAAVLNWLFIDSEENTKRELLVNLQ